MRTALPGICTIVNYGCEQGELSRTKSRNMDRLQTLKTHIGGIEGKSGGELPSGFCDPARR